MSAWAWAKRLKWTAVQYARRPSWQMSLILIGFLLGVAVHSWINQPLPASTLFIIACVLVPIGATIILGQNTKSIALFLLVLAAIAFGLARYASSFPINDSTSVERAIDANVRLQGVVVSAPTASATYQQAVLDRLELNGEAANNKVLAYLPTSPALHYGQKISFRCTLVRPEPFDGFAYDRYLLRVGIVATCFSHDEPLVVEEAPWSVRGAIFTLRQTSQRLLQTALPEPAASISAGLLLGLKTLPDDLEKDFQKIGVSHIFAASGSNVAMMLLVVTGALAYVVRRQRAFTFLLAAVVIYVLLAGAEAAVVRAGIMAVVVLIANQSGRASSTRNLILLAATVMLLANPRLLRDDVGFQLSMLATTGMAVLTPRLNTFLAFMPKALGLRQALSTTLSATLFTLPIMIFNFHQFPLISPVANLLILPLVPYAMVTATFAGLAVLVHPSLGVAVGGFAWALEQLIMLIAGALAAI